MMGECLPCVRLGAPTSPFVQLNVGGVCFSTTLDTLQKSPPGSALAEMLEKQRPRDGVYFLDRDGRHFRYILNFLRDGIEVLSCIPEDAAARAELIHEARRMNFTPLVDALVSFEMSAPKNAMLVSGQQVSDVAPASESPEDGESAYLGALLPTNEAERLSRIADLKDQQSIHHDHTYDSLTRVAAGILDVPIVLISFVEQECQWFPYKVGLEDDSTPRPTSICAFMLKPEDPRSASMLVIEDADRDARVNRNPLVIGEPKIRFYAGCPLQTSDGLRLGALCAIDQAPRSISHAQSQTLINLGTLVVQELERDKLIATFPREDSDMFFDEPGGYASCRDFSCGSMRTKRMHEALQESVLLVWARDDTTEWPVLYANRAWHEKSKLVIHPTTRFPVQPTCTGSALRVQSTEGRPLMLWNWLRLGKSSQEDYSVLLRYVKQSSRGEAELPAPRCFPLSCAVPACAWGGHPSDTRLVSVSCRFSPAELPLDANAAAIRAVPQAAPETPSSVTLRGYPSGHLFFLTVVTDRMHVLARRMTPSSASANSQRTESSTVSGRRAPTTQASSASSAASNHCVNQTSSGNSAGALTNIKPPRPPFEDVRLLSRINQGSFGSVYFGLWSGSTVAVKVLETKVKDPTQGPPTLHTFEACLAVTLSHPNLVQAYKHSARIKDQSVPPAERTMETWIVQEYCDGGTLGEFIKSKPMVMQETLEILLEIASAGEYLHGRGIIHGDLTANNAFLKTQGTRKGYIVKVADFGLARIVEGDTCEVLTNTMGTVTHMPPEIFSLQKGACRLTQRADVYAYGILMWQLVTRKLPYENLSPPQVVIKVARGNSLQLPEGTHEEYVSVYLQCIDREPGDRPTFEELTTSIFALHVRQI